MMNLEAHRAFEAKHNCKILREFVKVPPADFQALVIQQANTYYCITNAYFIENVLVAESMVARHNTGTESLYSMLDGLTMGYKLGLPKLQAYSITYTQIKLAGQYKKTYAGKQQWEILEDLNSNRHFAEEYMKELPAYLVTKKKVTEHFTTWEEAQERARALSDYGIVGPIQQSDNHWRVIHDPEKDCHF